MVVSPTSNILWTCDAEVISQIFNRRNDFSKAVEMLGMLNIYGRGYSPNSFPSFRLF